MLEDVLLLLDVVCLKKRMDKFLNLFIYCCVEVDSLDVINVDETIYKGGLFFAIF